MAAQPRRHILPYLDARIDRLDARQTTRLDRLDQDIKGMRKDLAVLSERLTRVETKLDQRDNR